ncbi:DUF1672 family protein, partial [Staphylococcus epidermidis]|uniref:DUF1672 family protein n=1 Tax=Staphylococcus epidermidis TaxID=1282 RepID=UPI0037DA594F
MPPTQYKPQPFQPLPQKTPIPHPKKHPQQYQKLPEQFFKHNFTLNLKPTNVLPTPHPLQLYLHSHHHHILFNPTILFHNQPIHQQASMPTNHNAHTMTHI